MTKAPKKMMWMKGQEIMTKETKEFWRWTVLDHYFLALITQSIDIITAIMEEMTHSSARKTVSRSIDTKKMMVNDMV